MANIPWKFGSEREQSTGCKNSVKVVPEVLKDYRGS